MPSIFAVLRNLVQEKWFCKLWFFFWFEKSGWLEKQVGLYYKSIFFSGLRKVVDQEKIWSKNNQWTSGFRKVVLQTLIFFLVNHFSRTRKMWIYGIKPPFFLVNHFSRTRFLEPDFSNQISRNCKIRGRRIKGWILSCYKTLNVNIAVTDPLPRTSRW